MKQKRVWKNSKMTTLHNDLAGMSAAAKGAVIAIGNFDGLHLGHRALIAKAQGLAKTLAAPSGVMTFEPHPREYFQKNAAPFRLTLLPMKQRLLGEMGVDHLYALGFDAALAGLSGQEFIDRILVEQLQVKHVVVGADFAFGRDRSGTIDTLKASGKFGVTVVEPVLCPDGTAYSSSRIRDHLSRAEFDAANALLGWNWQMEAPVVHGDKRGRELGYPTANQITTRYIPIPYGIYAVEVLIENESHTRRGVANFGIRPMFRIEQPLFETFIFDFSAEIYDKVMRVRPLKFLRPEAAFSGIEALKDQMKQDCLAARAMVKSS